MQTAIVEKVRERAYALWKADGMVEGRDLDHWCAAEREIVGAPPPVAETRRRKRAARSRGAVKA